MQYPVGEVWDNPKPRSLIVVCVTGNPGVIGCYRPLLSSIHERVSAETADDVGVIGFGLPGHGCMSNHPEQWRDLSQQAHALATLLSDLVARIPPPSGSRGQRIVLMGHSIGAWLSVRSVECLAALARGSSKCGPSATSMSITTSIAPPLPHHPSPPSAEAAATVLSRLATIVGLFPTYAHIGRSRNAVDARRFLFIAPIITVLSFLVRCITLNGRVPHLIEAAAWLAVGWKPEGRLAPTVHCVSRAIANGAAPRILHLAAQEMREQGDAPTCVWVASAASRLRVLYSSNDGWVPDAVRDDLASRLGTAATLAEAHVGHSGPVSEPDYVADWICGVVGDAVKGKAGEGGPQAWWWPLGE